MSEPRIGSASDTCEHCGGFMDMHRPGCDRPQQEPQHHIPPALLEALIDLALNPSETTANRVRAANKKEEK